MEIFEPHVFATSLATLVVIQDPVGAIPIFLSLTGKQSDVQRKRSARTATLVSLGVILVFALAGRYILEFLGITVPALQLSGGLLLLLVALELLTDKMDEHPDPDATGGVNAALVPLGTPLLAGPGAIVAAMVAADSSGSTAGWISVGVAIVVSHVVIWLTLHFSTVLNRILKQSGITLLTRIAGLLLAAIAVQMMVDAVETFVKQFGA